MKLYRRNVNMSIFEKFNQNVDVEGIKEDINNAGTGEYEDTPHGKYEVEVAKLELTTTKTNPRPMLTIWFRILEGEYKGSFLFYNQPMYSATGEYAGMMTGFCNEMLTSLDSDLEVVFEDFVQYEQLVLDIAEDIEGRKEYIVDYSDNKGFDKFDIVEVFDV